MDFRHPANNRAGDPETEVAPAPGIANTEGPPAPSLRACPVLRLEAAVAAASRLLAGRHSCFAPRATVVLWLNGLCEAEDAAATLDALIGYGLVEQRGDVYRLTERAIAIVDASDPAAGEAALLAAALNPPAFSAIFRRFPAPAIPYREELCWYLLVELNLPVRIVEEVAATYRANAQFVARCLNRRVSPASAGVEGSCRAPEQPTISRRSAAASMSCDASGCPSDPLPPRQIPPRQTPPAMPAIAGRAPAA